MTANYIDLAPISQISRFRSGAGHSYTDTFESCRSMKHYFQPRFDVNWATLRIYTPAGFKLVSWFDAITDPIFETYRARGIAQRSDAIISRATRDGAPLTCSGEGFTAPAPADSWITLR